MTEQVVDIRDRIEKMRYQMSGDKVPESSNVKNKVSTVEKLNVSKPTKDLNEKTKILKKATLKNLQ